MPNTGLSLASAYADGLAALKLDAANPLAWQGFMSGHAAVVPGRFGCLPIGNRRYRRLGNLRYDMWSPVPELRLDCPNQRFARNTT